MRAALGLAFIAAVAVTGCGRSEEQQKAEFRQQFLSQCGQAIRSQPTVPAGLDPDSVCTCVADRLFTGKSASEITRIVNDQTGVTQATTECAMQELGGSGAATAQPGAVQPEAAAPAAEAAGEAAEEAADDTVE